MTNLCGRLAEIYAELHVKIPKRKEVFYGGGPSYQYRDYMDRERKNQIDHDKLVMSAAIELLKLEERKRDA